ncbi:hypothetical protein GX865_02110 [Candidatus Saccharibacteria bacterium]|jgi:hypothetical protein|nr:hypothetical protein [Candidatus Saccharibacteria bacterium]
MNDTGVKQQIVDSVKGADTILVTVGQNPSVDELSAALGLTMYFNDLGKHATAVVSGDIPPAITFLKPEKTFENSVDSLRDFVIALDKEKADHLRYKVDGDVVKIFITPYKTVISQKDLEYSQGDYNVEMVLALGVKSQDQLDKALSAHGRILHDASVATIGLEPSTLGTMDWNDAGASSLCELAFGLTEDLKNETKPMTERVASALLTGVVAATDRFSNDKTTAESMTVSAKLMAIGANQQLIAAKLREGSKLELSEGQATKRIGGQTSGQSKQKRPDKKPNDKNSLSISHEPTKEGSSKKAESKKEATSLEAKPPVKEEQSSPKPKSSPAKPNRVEGESLPPINQDKPNKQPLAPAPKPPAAPPAPASAPKPPQSPAPKPPALPPQGPPPAQPLPPPPTPVVAPAPAPASPTPPAPSQPPQAGDDALSKLDKLVTPASTPTGSAADEAARLASELATEAENMEKIEAPAPPEIGTIRQSAPVHSQGNKPAFGGTLNATTHQAAEDKRLNADDQQNRAILSHGSGKYIGDSQPSYQSPLNGVGMNDEPPRVDPFAEPSSPVATAKPVAAPSQIPALPPLSPEPSPGMPATPPPPPTPDFSQLPPMPPDMPDFSQLPPEVPGGATLAPDQPLGEMLPPPPAPMPSATPADPGQFKIPGQ